MISLILTSLVSDLGEKGMWLARKKVFYRQGILQGKVRQNLRKVFGKVSEKVTNLCTEAATTFR